MKNLAIAVVLIAAVTIAGCTYHDALVLAKDAASDNQAFAEGTIKAHADGFVDDTTERRLLDVSNRIAKDDDAVVTALTGHKDVTGALAHLDLGIAEIDDAIQNGLAFIKNDGKKAEIHALLLALRGTLVTAKALLTK